VLFVHGRFTVMLKGVNNFIPLILHFFTGLGAVRCSMSPLDVVGYLTSYVTVDGVEAVIYARA
jgi:hypothetical protein